MIRPTIRPALCAFAASTALWLAPAAPLAAQQTFDLPPASPTPTPAPAGPADERAGVEIPPRAAPAPSASATATPAPAPAVTATPRPAPSITPPAPIRTAPAQVPTAAATAGAAPAPSATIAPAPLPSQSGDPIALPSSAPFTLPTGTATEGAATEAEFTDTIIAMPTWQLIAVGGGVGALGLLGAGALLKRRRKHKALRLADPVADRPGSEPTANEPPRLDLTLEISAATRSLMMFTLEYRLVIANRSGRAVNDARVAVELACARASGGARPSASAVQGLTDVDRIGPHQARSVRGTVQIPLSAIAPLRQGQTPLFIPLVHVTLDAEGLPALVQTFVIGQPSASGRVHPISLDQPPGGIAGLVAQAVALPPGSAAA
jgi:hypothetical protein